MCVQIQLKTRMADPDRQIWQTEITSLKRCIEQHVVRDICGLRALELGSDSSGTGDGGDVAARAALLELG